MISTDDIFVWDIRVSFLAPPTWKRTMNFWNYLVLGSQKKDNWEGKHTVGELKDLQIAVLWSKTTIFTSSVGGTRMNPPYCKMSTFFLRSLALSVPIYRYFQSNGANWQSIERWTKKKLYSALLCKFFFQCLILSQLSPFDWKCL